MLPQDFYHTLACGVSHKEGMNDAIILQRNRRQGHYETQQLDSLDILSLHMRHSLKASAQFHELRLQKTVFAEMMERVDLGIALLDDRGKVIHLNRKANHITTTKGSGLRLSGQRIALERTSEDRHLQILIQGAIAGQPRTGGTMRYCAPGSFRPYSIMITPVDTERNQLRFDIPKAAAALFIRTPIAADEIDQSAVMTEFGLSAKEAAVAIAISSGQSPEEISQTRHTSLHTVRTQLKAIFRKTQTSRQTDLTRLLLSSTSTLMHKKQE